MLDAIRKMIRGSADAPPSAAALAEALDRLDADIVRSRNTIAKLDEQRADAVLDGDGAAKALRAKIADQAADLADLEAARSRVAERLTAAKDAEAEAERRRRYDEARAKVEAARKKLGGYAKARRDILEIVRAIAEADAAAEAANRDLPADAAPIAECEAVRDLPGRDAEVVSERSVSRWFARIGGEALPVERESELTITKPDEAHLIHRRPIGDGKHEASHFHYVRRDVIERVIRPAAPGVRATRLAKLSLPGATFADADFEPQRSDASPQTVIRAVEMAGGPSGVEAPEAGETVTQLIPLPPEARAA